MKKNLQTLLISFILLMAFFLTSCNNIPDGSSVTSQTTEITETNETEPAQATSVEVTSAKSEPVVPEGPGFTLDSSRPLDIVASYENVIIVGNGNIHDIDGYVPGSYGSYYPMVGSFNLCGIGRNQVDNLPAIQYSVDRSVVGLKILDNNRQSYFDPGKIVIYDGSNETVVAQDALSFSLSADAKKVAYLMQNEDSGINGSLFLFDVQTGESELLSETAGPSYILSMTGQSIVFTEYSDGSSSESWRVMLKTEGAEEKELTHNMFPIAVSDDGSYVYTLEEQGEDTYRLWVFQNGSSKCIGSDVKHTYMTPVIFNSECSQVIYNAGDTYFSQDGEKGVRLDVDGCVYHSTALIYLQYMMHAEETFTNYERPEVHYLCTGSLLNVVHVTSDEKYRSWLERPDESLRFWFFNENLEVDYLSAEEVYQLYNGHDEYLIQLDKIIEQEAYAYRLHETIFRRDDEPDIKYYLDTEKGGRNAVGYMGYWNYETSDELRQSYIQAHYFDLYVCEEPFDGTPIKVAERVSQVWSDDYGVYYICLEEINQTLEDYFVNPTKYIYEEPDHGTMVIKLGACSDKNGLYYSTDGTTFQRAAYTIQSYIPMGLG